MGRTDSFCNMTIQGIIDKSVEVEALVLSLGGGWRGAADGSGFLLRMRKNVLKLSVAMGTHFKKTIGCYMVC